MNAHVAAWGRLVADPERRESRTGKPWASARLAVDMPRPYNAPEDAEAPTWWLSVTAFGERQAEALARHRKGECLSVAGRLEMRPYVAKSGEHRDGLTVIADSVIGPRSPRPGGGKKRGTAALQDNKTVPEAQPAPDDPLPW